MAPRISARAVVAVTFLLASCGGATATVGEGAGGYRLRTNPDGSPTGNGSTCTYAGTTTSVGQTFKAPDGCNDCTCTAQGAACTERACGGTSGTSSGSTGTSCTYEGKAYPPGATWTVPNPSCPAASAQCTCGANGEAACAAPAIACVDAGASCPPGSCGPQLGMPNYPCADGTMGGPGPCEMQSSGKCGWTIVRCTCTDAKGVVHEAGDSWMDLCNTCTCSQTGTTSCTTKPCAAP